MNKRTYSYPCLGKKRAEKYSIACDNKKKKRSCDEEMALIEGNGGHCYDHYRFYAS